jgi:hypothetical protein
MKRQRNNMQAWTAAEHAICNALREVEKMDGDVLLTKAVILLSDAQNAVAGYLDLHPEKAKVVEAMGVQQATIPFESLQAFLDDNLTKSKTEQGNNKLFMAGWIASLMHVKVNFLQLQKKSAPAKVVEAMGSLPKNI